MAVKTGGCRDVTVHGAGNNWKPRAQLGVRRLRDGAEEGWEKGKS